MSASMTQTVAEKKKVDASSLINDLLSALHIVRMERWEDFDFLDNTVKTAQEVKDSKEYNT